MTVLLKDDENNLCLIECTRVARFGYKTILATQDGDRLVCNGIDGLDYEARLKDAVTGRRNGIDFSDYRFGEEEQERDPNNFF